MCFYAKHPKHIGTESSGNENNNNSKNKKLICRILLDIFLFRCDICIDVGTMYIEREKQTNICIYMYLVLVAESLSFVCTHFGQRVI